MVALLPPSVTPLERALDDIGQRAEAIPATAVAVLKDPLRVPAPLLAWLAWEYSVDEWPAPVGERRRMIAAAPHVHRVKGTLAALRAALAARGYAATVVEWFAAVPAAQPYTFAIDIEVRDRPWAEADYDAALATVLAAKNLRSHLARLTVRQTSHAQPAHIAAVAIPNEIISVFPPAPADGDGAAPLAIVAAVLLGDAVVTAVVVIDPVIRRRLTIMEG